MADTFQTGFKLTPMDGNQMLYLHLRLCDEAFVKGCGRGRPQPDSPSAEILLGVSLAFLRVTSLSRSSSVSEIWPGRAGGRLRLRLHIAFCTVAAPPADGGSAPGEQRGGNWEAPTEFNKGEGLKREGAAASMAGLRDSSGVRKGPGGPGGWL